MSSCPPRAGAKRTAPSPTPNAASPASAPSARRRATRARTGGNSPRSDDAWAGREAFAWRTPAEVFREHAALSGHANNGSAGVRHQRHGRSRTRPATPRCSRSAGHCPPGAASEGGRLFAQGGFSTPDGRARLVPTPLPGPAAGRGASCCLNTGRVRDQWHTMTRTGLAPSLMSHTPEPLLTIHPVDAAAAGIAPGRPDPRNHRRGRRSCCAPTCATPSATASCSRRCTGPTSSPPPARSGAWSAPTSTRSPASRN